MASHASSGRSGLGRPGAVDLELVEQVVLLSIGGHRASTHRAARVAGKSHPGRSTDFRSAITVLEDRKLVTREGFARQLTVTMGPTRTRYARVVHNVIGSTDIPDDADAELFALLAAAGTLPVGSVSDHLRARHRLADLGRCEPLPAGVLALMDDVGAETTKELADKLLPPQMFPLAEHASSRPISYGYTYLGQF